MTVFVQSLAAATKFRADRADIVVYILTQLVFVNVCIYLSAHLCLPPAVSCYFSIWRVFS